MANDNKIGSGTQGGNRDQHVKAGEQSHKNDIGTRQSPGSGGTTERGGNREEHVKAGQKSHKND